MLVRLAALDDVILRARDRSRYAVAYAKGADAIAETLALAGASDAALLVDEHAVVARLARTPTGSRTPTRRTSSVRAVRRTRSCARCGG